MTTKTWWEQGGAAFPVPATDIPNAPEGEHGMTLRDWFAGQALAALPLGEMHVGDAADDAYEIADAMLKARGA